MPKPLRVLEVRDERPQCPSARPDMPGSALLGVFQEQDGRGLLAYLDRPAPVTEELLELARPLSPTQLFRFSAPCVGNGCQHFDGENCRLAKKIAQRLETAVDVVPECTLRSVCRWRLQEGDAACLRCPMILTESYGATAASEALRVAANPATPV
jgi:hypothetical protein